MPDDVTQWWLSWYTQPVHGLCACGKWASSSGHTYMGDPICGPCMWNMTSEYRNE